MNVPTRRSAAPGAVLLTGAALSAILAGQASAQTSTPEDDADPTVDRVVVTASGFAQDVSQAPASITVLSGADLELQRNVSLAEALATVEGVDIDASSDKTGGLSISIRGMPSDYSLILIDGRRQNTAGSVTPNNFGSTSTSFIPPVSAIERIEVVRGPVSTLYGSDAMGGVVNIITKKVSDVWSGTVSLDTTIQTDDAFGDMHGGNLYANGPIAPGLLGLALRGRFQNRGESELTYVTVNGVEEPVGGFGRSASRSEVWSAGGRLTFTPHPDHELWADYDYTTQWYDNSCDIENGQAVRCRMGTQDTEARIAGYSDFLEFNREQMSLAHNWSLPFGKLQTDLSRNFTETLGRTIPGNPDLIPNAGEPRVLETTNTILDTKLFSRWRNHSFTAGGQYWEADMTDGAASAPFSHEQWALFAEDEWRFTETFAITLGARHDDHSTFGGQFSPRAYAVWNLSPNVTLKGGVSRGFKTPRLEQLTDGIYGFGGQGTIPLIGTPSLTPETSTSYEAAILYDNHDGLTASLTLFNNDFTDKIASGTPVLNCSYGVTQEEYDAGDYSSEGCVDVGYWPARETFGQSINIDEAVTRGLEASVSAQLTDDWALTANYTYTDSEQKSGSSAGEPLVNTPEHMLNANLRWNATERLSAWVRGEYRSSRFRNEDRGTSTAKQTYGDYKAYEVFHLGASYAVSDAVTLNATIYNLLDKDFVTRLPYTATDGSIGYTDMYVNAQEPRRLWLSINADF